MATLGLYLLLPAYTEKSVVLVAAASIILVALSHLEHGRLARLLRLLGTSSVEGTRHGRSTAERVGSVLLLSTKAIVLGLGRKCVLLGRLLIEAHLLRLRCRIEACKTLIRLRLLEATTKLIGLRLER